MDKMKKTQLAIFVYLALLMSFALALVLVLGDNKSISKYKFSTEKYFKDLYFLQIKENLNESIAQMFFDFSFYNIYSFYYCDKNFIYFCALESKKKDKLNKMLSDLEEKIKKREKLEFKFDENLNEIYRISKPYKLTLIYNAFKQLSPDIESNLVKSLFSLFSNNLQKETFYLINKSTFKIECYFKHHTIISEDGIFLYEPYKNEVRIKKIPIEVCFYQELKNEKLRVDEKRIYLNLIPLLVQIYTKIDNKTQTNDYFFKPNIKEKDCLINEGYCILNNDEAEELKNNKFMVINLEDEYFGLKGFYEVYFLGDYLLISEKNKNLLIYSFPFQPRSVSS